MTQIAPHHPAVPRNGRPGRVPVAAPSAPAAPRRPARPSLFVAPAIVVLGRDESGKPHASWFGEADVRAAERAAQLMGMRSLGVAGGDEALGTLAARLPSGRLFQSGRAFVPFVKGDLYDQLVAYLPAEAEGTGPVSDGTVAAEASGEADVPVAITAPPSAKAVGARPPRPKPRRTRATPMRRPATMGTAAMTAGRATVMVGPTTGTTAATMMMRPPPTMGIARPAGRRSASAASCSPPKAQHKAGSRPSSIRRWRTRTSS